ncbi:DivIVA domain-containing protein [Planotetraspora sp. A-T 1434]|uniref:DivIVA domain-containing protein n=1 Tax=Planotetraspora sp. A-T 1434 TaxID=2979219 RepID=UPI0021BF53AD|nr:DivIVA domain-containing protein [Planotetraspora sp. A-T 1434]MCT9930401.1 DivIVA domain-containing protein [Planotetraspora sp. A-T 1434]
MGPAHRDPPSAAGLLSPADIRNQVFTVVRLREGYDLAEVDRFLGRVEAALIRLLRDNEELRARAAAAEHSVGCGAQLSPTMAADSAVQLVDVARAAAERTLALAHQEAQAVLAQARGTAEEVQQAALNKAVGLREAVAGIPYQELDSRIQVLHTFIANFGSGLKDTLDGQINRLHTLLDELHDRAGDSHDHGDDSHEHESRDRGPVGQPAEGLHPASG